MGAQWSYHASRRTRNKWGRSESRPYLDNEAPQTAQRPPAPPAGYDIFSPKTRTVSLLPLRFFSPRSLKSARF
jgi:hypothetical protein